MEPARIREDVDPNSPKYRRNLIIVIAIVLGLSIIGGTCLGYKIRGAENAEAAVESDEPDEQPTRHREAPERR